LFDSPIGRKKRKPFPNGYRTRTRTFRNNAFDVVVRRESIVDDVDYAADEQTENCEESGFHRSFIVVCGERAM